MSTIFVSGAIANKPFNGGEAWVRLSWAMGLKKLGHRVIFIEQIDPKTCLDPAGAHCSFESSVNLSYFKQVCSRFGFADSAALIYDDGEKIHGLSREELFRLADSAELLINISGHLSWGELMSRIKRKAYIDIDPGFTQFWHADPSSKFKVNGHDFYYTIGKNIGTARCAIPTGGINWRHVDQPVVMEEWEETRKAERGTRNEMREESSSVPRSAFRLPRSLRFTTVAAWRGSFGSVYFGGQSFGLKVHEFRKVIDLPKRLPHRFEIALDIHPADVKDRAGLVDHGWSLVDPKQVAAGPTEFREYVLNSDAEFSVAQGIYVQTNSGWFSDRTVRYLASGKPVLVQDTGWSSEHSAGKGEGLVTFKSIDAAVAGAEDIHLRYEEHATAARRLAEKYFDSDVVLSQMLSEMEIAK